MAIVDDDPAETSKAESQPAPQHAFAVRRQLHHRRGKEPLQHWQTAKMRRPHSDHFDRTSETTEGIGNTCFSRAVNPEKRNLKPRFARDNSFRFHGVKVRQLSLQSSHRSGHSGRCSLYCFFGNTGNSKLIRQSRGGEPNLAASAKTKQSSAHA